MFFEFDSAAVEAFTSVPAAREGLELLRDSGLVVLGVEDIPYGVAVEAAAVDFESLTSVQIAVRLTELGDRLRCTADCSCRNVQPCAHLAAVLLSQTTDFGRPELYSDAIRARGSTPQPGNTDRLGSAFGRASTRTATNGITSSKPPWQKALDAALEGDAELGHATPHVALFVELHQERRRRNTWQYAPVRKDTYVAARPAVRGARDKWIKGNASWDRLNGLPLSGKQAALMAELLSAYSQSRQGDYYYVPPEWLPLDGAASRTLWSLLHELRASGIELISTAKQQRSIELSDSVAIARFDIVEARKRLRVLGEIEHAGETLASDAVRFIGDPPVGFAQVLKPGTAEETLRFARFEGALSSEAKTLFTRNEPLSIASADRDLFERDYLPLLRGIAEVHSSDRTYAVPKPQTPTLELLLDYDGDAAHLRWRWNRGRLGALRDETMEAQTHEAVRAAASAHPHLLFGPSGSLRWESVLGRVDAVVFTGEVLPALRKIAGLRIEESEAAPTYRVALERPVVDVTAQANGTDWFDLNFTVTVEGEEVIFSDVFAALSLEEPIFVLPSGIYFSLDGAEFDRLREVIEEARVLGDRPVERLRVSRYQVDLWQELVELGVVAASEAAWRETVAALSDTAVLELVEPPTTLDATIRDYQRLGMSWMHFLRTNGLGGILADEMGLGKTVQSIAMMELARAELGDAMPPFLVVAPTSVVSNWASECAKFAPGLRAVTISATEARRKSTLDEAIGDAHVVVTSYALFRLEFDSYQERHWSGLLLDEAQMIKNHTSRGYKCAKLLDTPFKLAITGTPLENNVLELWSLVSLVCPGLLGGLTHFTEFFRQPIERDRDSAKLATLKRRLRPFLLRRTKELVAGDLPPKREQVLELDLLPAHRRLYDRRLQRERQKVLGLVDDVDSNRFQIFRSLTMLRQLALDAELVEETSAPSAKLEALAVLLGDAVSEGHKVIVFSQFTRFLSKAKDQAAAAGVPVAYLDGSTPNRGNVIDEFRSGSASVFFISLKAGGFGLNLTEADYVILLDPWWNPATEAQAIDRTHRIGQTRSVMIYRLVARDTIESKVMALKAQKSALFADVLDGDSSETGTTLSAEDIRELLA